ncbi:MAG: dioxygenase [SAR324 cluster bacterium]|nr:dioxygenase [SAR324 cluster bacterium]
MHNTHKMPVIFVSHGAPDLPLTRIPAYHFFCTLSQKIPEPKGIVAISAHWLEKKTTVGTSSRLETIHDFYGFPPALYEMEYPAKNNDSLVETVCDSLTQGGIAYELNSIRGLDHGAWCPLRLMYPEADIPVIPVSLIGRGTPEQHLKTGQALATLREQGILILASGAMTHNLSGMKPEGSLPDPWAINFVTWIEDKLMAQNQESLLRYRERAPQAEYAHPSSEHFDPLLVAVGAAGDDTCSKLHASFSYGNLSMASYGFGMV